MLREVNKVGTLKIHPSLLISTDAAPNGELHLERCLVIEKEEDGKVKEYGATPVDHYVRKAHIVALARELYALCAQEVADDLGIPVRATADLTAETVKPKLAAPPIVP
jgi:hypothetical protein